MGLRIGDDQRSFNLVVGYHGTSRQRADVILAGGFTASRNSGDWLGHGIYFWEYAPNKAWEWARSRFGDEAAVVAGLIDLGRCIDLLDPAAGWQGRLELHLEVTRQIYAELGQALPKNGQHHKVLDCAVVNSMCRLLDADGPAVDSLRALFVPSPGGLPRLWPSSGLLHNTHIQLCVRNSDCIVRKWPCLPVGQNVEIPDERH